MMKQPLSWAICMALAVIVAAGAASAPENKKQFKDRQEYTLYDSATKETDANRKLVALNAWKDKYPDSDFKQERLVLFLNTYQTLGEGTRMVDTAKQILELDPKDVTALYWVTFLAPSLGDNSADAVATATRAANGLLTMEKPAAAKDEGWKIAKTNFDAIAYKTLGWAAMVPKNYAEAEQNYKKSLQINPGSGEVAYSLGQALLGQSIAGKKPEVQSEALYYFARAAAYEGPGALNPDGRKKADDYLTKVYNTLHGDSSGLAELKALAKANPTTPSDFKIKTAAEVDAEMAKLPILNGGSSVAFLAADRKCAEQFQKAFSMEGLEKRKRLAELVQYKCGLVVDTPVHLAKLPVETVEAIQHKATYTSVTIAEGESKGKSGWVPTSWVTNY
jgi:tetratricopeptide (TPR) repeat protein